MRNPTIKKVVVHEGPMHHLIRKNAQGEKKNKQKKNKEQAKRRALRCEQDRIISQARNLEDQIMAAELNARSKQKWFVLKNSRIIGGGLGVFVSNEVNRVPKDHVIPIHGVVNEGEPSVEARNTEKCLVKVGEGSWLWGTHNPR